MPNISSNFGYWDYQINWTSLEEFIKFKTPFKDYLFEYGSFFLFVQSFGYLLSGKNFLAVLISRNLYLPIIAVFLSYVVAKNILGKKQLIFIFLFFALLSGTNYNFVSIRHLMAELSLSFFILYFFKNDHKYLFISGIIAGLSVLTTLEYGVALNLTILFIFLFSFFSEVKLKSYFLNQFLLGQLIILAPYFFWLYAKGALGNYWQLTFGFINNFYYASPCSRDTFPRLSEIQTLAPVSKLMVFGVPIEFLQRLNFYGVYIFFLINALALFIIFARNRKFTAHNLMRVGLVIYGLFIFSRTLDTPCMEYFSYGLVPFFLILTLLIGDIFRGWQKISVLFQRMGIFVIMTVFLWFVLTENTGLVIKIFSRGERQAEKVSDKEKEFYSPVGYFIKKDLAEGYKEITNYIIENTTQNDFLYVYPWGPYNNLTGRKSPTSTTHAVQFLIAGEELELMTKKELETKKPKFIVINIYNNLGFAKYKEAGGDIDGYLSLGEEDGPAFAGGGNGVERYILENYETVFHNNLAIVMRSRSNRVELKESKKVIYVAENWQKESIELKNMVRKGEGGKYAIKGKNASWTLTFTPPVEAEEITIEFKLDGNLLTKHFTRYFLNFYATIDGEEEPRQTKDLAIKEWQGKKLLFNKPEKINTIKLEIGENTGLIWWLNPSSLEVKKVSISK